MVYDKWAIYTGGKQNHLNLVPFGIDGFNSLFVKFYPAVAHSYWASVQDKDWDSAAAVIRDQEKPFLDYIRVLKGGFAAGLYGAMELRGIGKRWRRSPYYSLNESEMEQLGAFLKSQGWL